MDLAEVAAEKIWDVAIERAPLSHSPPEFRYFPDQDAMSEVIRTVYADQSAELERLRSTESFSGAIRELAESRCGHKGMHSWPPTTSIRRHIDRLEADNAALRTQLSELQQQVARLKHLLGQAQGWIDDPEEAEEADEMMSRIDAALQEPSRDA